MRQLFLLGSLLLLTTFALAAPGQTQFRVLQSSTRTVEAPPDVPQNCDFISYDAYCHNSAPVSYQQNVLVVEDNGGKSMTVACTVENNGSRCADLPVNGTFTARSKKSGLEISYTDDQHRTRKAFYSFVTDHQR